MSEDKLTLGAWLVLSADSGADGTSDPEFEESIGRILSHIQAQRVDDEVTEATGLLQDDDAVGDVVLTWTSTVLAGARSLPAAGTEVFAVELAVDDEVFFRATVGRRKRPLEPWPSLRVAFASAAAGHLITALLRMPELAATDMEIGWEIRMQWGDADAVSVPLRPSEGGSAQLSGTLRWPQSAPTAEEFASGSLTLRQIARS